MPHPLFGRLLRRRVEPYYELRVGLPVGDMPREADLVLLRRMGAGPPPFQGLWRFLTTWNILEFKGPTVAPRQRDLNRLVELGFGIDRRLNAERSRQGKPVISEEEVSFWYLTNRLGEQFLRTAGRRLAPLEECADGLWRCRVMGYSLMLVSAVDLVVDEDSLPLHVLAKGTRDKERQVGEFLVENVERIYKYGSMFAGVHPKIWKEVATMARRKGQDVPFDVRAVVDTVGLAEAIRQIGKKEVVEELDVDDILAGLSRAKRRELERRLKAESARQ